MLLVTGANGFVGRAVLAEALTRGIDSRGAVRSAVNRPVPTVEYVHGIDLTASSDWREALGGVRTVVHAAARVHVMRDTALDVLAEFRRVNVDGTVNLARQAAAAGVRRFIFISSVKVNGEQTTESRPFLASDAPAPIDPYGISKWEAEEALRTLAGETGLEVVTIRPVLVYGPGVKANVAAMMRWLSRGVPLPFGAIDNMRSLVALDNLVDLVLTCTSHPAAPGQTFLVSDGEDLSTSELLRRMAAALGVRARLIPVPLSVLRAGARALGRRDLARRLFESLQVDVGPTRSRLGWAPPVSVDDALRATAQCFLRLGPGR